LVPVPEKLFCHNYIFMTFNVTFCFLLFYINLKHDLQQNYVHVMKKAFSDSVHHLYQPLYLVSCLVRFCFSKDTVSLFNMRFLTWLINHSNTLAS